MVHTHLFGFVLGNALLALSYLAEWRSHPYWVLYALSYIAILFSIRKVVRVPWESSLTKPIITAIEQAGMTLETFVST